MSLTEAERPSTTLGSPPVDVDTEEVRVAMALNGGVSLAVWMGGCAVELDRARRAHVEPDDAAASIYAVLCRAFKRELVLDIFAGASAGGINGGLLAAAIRAGRKLDAKFLRDRWLEIGDFSGLLQRTNSPGSRSLLRGDFFYDELCEAFRAILGEPGANEKFLELTALPEDQANELRSDPQLIVTATDVIGEPKSFRDWWGQQLYASQYRARFRFRTDDDFTAHKLAGAARSTASFPFAFEPWRIDDRSEGDKPLPKEQNLLPLAGFTYPRYVIDGGLLDNAPIRAALQLIPTRGATRQVRRLVCYVNAAPPDGEQPDVPPLPGPSLRSVIGYVINLPRNAPFIDELEAIAAASARADVVAELQEPLLETDLDALTTTAQAMLSAYQSRRLLSSLEELLDDSGKAREAAASMSNGIGVVLPWIPQSFGPVTSAADWHWGIRPAERVLYLLIDIVRRALREAEREERRSLLEARAAIDAELTSLRDARAQLLGGQGIRCVLDDVVSGRRSDGATAALASLAGPYNEAAFAAVKSAADVVAGIAAILGEERCQALFGTPSPDVPLQGDALAHFTRRALAIELLRRSVGPDEDIDTAEELRFVQLTPFAPSPLFTSRPLTGPGPVGPEEKLTGIRLGHFAGFYRRSWRANDYLWGRLDAAARIVDMLVDAGRAKDVLRDGDATPPWELLADALLPADGGDAERELVREVLDELAQLRPWPRDIPERLRSSIGVALGATSESPGTDDDDLRDRLGRVLAIDLQDEDGGFITRTLCTRAVQLEIFTQEFPRVVEESGTDAIAGTYARPLEPPSTDEPLGHVSWLRGEFAKGQWLPVLLGRDSEQEIASSLALRGVTSSMLVSLGVLRQEKLPLTTLTSFIRPSLLQVGGAVSGSLILRVGAVAAFFSASSFITARVVSMSVVKGRHANLSMIWSRPVLVSLIAVLGLIGAIVVPLMRLIRCESPWRKLGNGFTALVLLASSGLTAAAMAHWVAGYAISDIVAAPNADNPNVWVLTFALAALGFVPFTRIQGVGLLVRKNKQISRVLNAQWGGMPMFLVIILALLATLYWTMPALYRAFGDNAWRIAAASLPFFGLATYAVYLFWRPLKFKWKARKAKKAVRAAVARMT